MRVILVAGIPGTRSVTACRRIVDWANGSDPEGGERWRLLDKFETHLEAEYLENEYPEGRDRPVNPRVALLRQPKYKLRELWQKSLERLRSDLTANDDGSIDLAVLPIHLVWFVDNLGEYMSVLDAVDIENAIAPYRIAHVLCLVDDIHDIYGRYRMRGGLYDLNSERLSPDDSRRGRAFRRHIRILDWRSREISTAETVARRSSCPMTTLATKHPIGVAVRCLKGEPQVYFSHPITGVREAESRNDLAKGGKAFKRVLWDLQLELSQHLALLQPTTIDEFRTNIDDCPISLLPRFYPTDFYGDSTMFESDDSLSDDIVYDDLDAHERQRIAEKDCAIARAVAETANDFTNLQVTARDLRLVGQADHLVVLRPRFNGRVSTGVYREISEFNLRTTYLSSSAGDLHRKILVLDTTDDDRMYWARQLVSKLVFAASAASEYEFSLLRISAWSPGGEREGTGSLEKDKALDYVAQISDATHGRIQDAATNGDLAFVADAVDAVVRDLGWDSWSLGQTGTPRPLESVQTFPYREDRKDRFLQDLKSDLEPLHKLKTFENCTFIDIAEKGIEDLVDVVRGTLMEEET